MSLGESEGTLPITGGWMGYPCDETLYDRARDTEGNPSFGQVNIKAQHRRSEICR